MNSKRFLVRIQYLGFRYHGVQKQPMHRSIHQKIEEVIQKSFDLDSFKIRFSSRTDAMVSSLDSYFVLMFEREKPLKDVENSLLNLPSDIKFLDIKEVEDNFNLLSRSKLKTYRYYFSFGKVLNSPLASPFMMILQEDLDLAKMSEAARLFQGVHYFENYSYKPKVGSIFERKIENSDILENHFLRANFFPEKSYYFEVSSRGFLRGQVRLMMGSLLRVGKNEMTLLELDESLKRSDPRFIKWMVPASGLILHETLLD